LKLVIKVDRLPEDGVPLNHRLRLSVMVEMSVV